MKSARQPNDLRGNLRLLVVLMTLVATLTGGIALTLTYFTAVEEEQDRLQETAQSVARLLEAIALQELRRHVAPSEGPLSAVLDVMREARQNRLGIGRTGELVLAQRRGDEIRFLLGRGHPEGELPRPVPWNSPLAEPMRRALSGESGTLTGPDYSGEPVLAAFAPVANLGLGVVAKIDLVELRAPFLHAGLLGLLISLAVVMVGGHLLLRLGNPLMERLRVGEERIRSTFHNAALGILILDPDGCIAEANPRMVDLTGRRPEQLTGVHLADLVDPADRASLFDALARVEKGREGNAFVELTLQPPDGTPFQAMLSLAQVRPEGLSPPHWIATVEDVTSQRAAQRELELLRQRDALILESAGEGIYGMDRAGRTTFINPAACRMLGWEAQELLGKRLHGISHHSHADGAPYPLEACPTTAAIRDGLIRRVDDEVFWRRDGSSFPVDYVSTPIVASGEVLGAVVTFSDISARLAAEQTRQKMEIQLRQAQKLEAIGQLAAGIAHEINTPAQYVGDNIRFLEEAFEDLDQLLGAAHRPAAVGAARAVAVPTDDSADLEELRQEIPQAIAQSLEGLERIARIVGAMKEFSHPGTRTKTPTDINRSVTNAVEVSRNEWKYHADLVTDLDPTLPLVPCLPAELNQTLLNIIVNAAHAVQAAVEPDRRGEIRITTRQTGDWAEICLSDTGCGIPEAIRGRIFDPFFTTKGVGKGTGQGLAIAYAAIVEKHRGTLEVESTVGVGTTFTIRLPINNEEEATAEDG